MKLHEAYIHVQQGLQNIAAFVYKNVELPELDYFWTKGTDKFIKLAFPNTDDDIRDERFEGIQASLDDLRAITVSNIAIALAPETSFGGYTFRTGPLPNTDPIFYRHLLNDRTIVSPVNCTTNETREVPNRLTRHDPIFNILENSLSKTAIASPISKVDGSIITVYNSYKGVKQFNIEGVNVDIIRKPTIYTYADNSDDDIEFPDDVCYKIIDTTLLYIMKVAEQNPNKIQFLAK
jgi:hypothetical protein